MNKIVNFLLGLTLVSLFSFAFAQDAVQGIPEQYQAMVYGMISVIAGLLVEPLTAILKRAGGTQGATTVGISAALSLLVAFGFTLAQALTTNQNLNFWGTLAVAFWAFLQSNGSYISKMMAAKRGTEKAGQDISIAAAQEKASQPDQTFMPLPSGLEEVPLDGTQGLLGLPLDMAAPINLNNSLSDIIKGALGVAGITVTDDRVLKVALRVLKVAPDLLDGNPHLSAETRLLVLNAIIDLKQGQLL